MKLFYSPSACSLAQHIALREAGLEFDLERVDLLSGRTSGGQPFADVNPKGYVPALMLDTGGLLTENVAIAEYVADQDPHRRLAPEPGTMDRYRFVEWLAFISSEVHKGFGPLWDKSTPETVRRAAKEKLAKRLSFLDRHLATRDYLMGDTFTAADAYLFTVLRWCAVHSVDMAPFAALDRYMRRVGERPAVRAALEAEAHGETGHVRAA